MLPNGCVGSRSFEMGADFGSGAASGGGASVTVKPAAGCVTAEDGAAGVVFGIGVGAVGDTGPGSEVATIGRSAGIGLAAIGCGAGVGLAAIGCGAGVALAAIGCGVGAGRFSPPPTTELADGSWSSFFGESGGIVLGRCATTGAGVGLCTLGAAIGLGAVAAGLSSSRIFCASASA